MRAKSSNARSAWQHRSHAAIALKDDTNVTRVDAHGLLLLDGEPTDEASPGPHTLCGKL